MKLILNTNMNIKTIIIAVTFLSIFLLTSCSTRKVPVGTVPNFKVPLQSNTSTSKKFIKEYFDKQNVKLVQSGSDYKRVREIVDRLSIAAGAGKFKYPLYIALTPPNQVNAMAVKSSIIVVNKPLVDKVPNDAELATVLAHEVAHILAEHSEDNTEQARGGMVGILADVVGNATAAATGSASLGSLSSTLSGTVASGAFVKSYSRGLEYEADHVGMMLMAKAGYHPKYAISFWEKAPSIFGAGGGISFLSTHPSSDDRTEVLEGYMPIAMGYYEKR